eukprot:g7759.t1
MVGPGGMVPHTGGGRRRHGGYVRVQDPAVGFFLGGSSIEEMNGLYGRVNSIQLATIHQEFHLAYRHDRNGWMMAMVKGPSDDYTPVGGKDTEWVIMDPYGNDRFGHSGATYIPGSGQRWEHVHRRAPNSGRRAPESFEKSLASKYEDDMEQLPWQLIAVLDKDMLEKLRNQERYDSYRKKRALSGNAPHMNNNPPPRSEIQFAQEHSWKAFNDFEKENYEEAAKLFRDALGYNALAVDHRLNNWAIALHLVNLAECCRKMHQFDEAVSSLQRATAMFPRYVDAYFQLGVTLMDAADYKAALDQFDQVLKLDRAKENLDKMIIMAKVSMEREKRAGEEIGKVVTLEDTETAYCIGWRQTGACDGKTGPREPAFDQPCNMMIENGASGYCECREVSGVERSDPIFSTFPKRHMESGCQHEVFSCGAKCRMLWESKVRESILQQEVMVNSKEHEKSRDLQARREEIVQGREAKGKALLAKQEKKHSEKWRTASHYSLLELLVDFTPEELKKQYRRMSIKYHPDKNGGSNAAFQQVAEAHQTLSDEERRKQYDSGKELDPPEDSNHYRFREEVERTYFPERFPFNPFGDPHEDKSSLKRERARRKVLEDEEERQKLGDGAKPEL